MGYGFSYKEEKVFRQRFEMILEKKRPNLREEKPTRSWEKLAKGSLLQGKMYVSE